MQLLELITWTQSHLMEKDELIVRFEQTQPLPRIICLKITLQTPWLFLVEKYHCESINTLGEFIESYQDNFELDLLQHENWEKILVVQWVHESHVATLYDARLPKTSTTSGENNIAINIITSEDVHKVRIYGTHATISTNGWGSEFVNGLINQIWGETSTQMVLPNENIPQPSRVLDPKFNTTASRKQVSFLMDLLLSENIETKQPTRFISMDMIHDWLQEHPSDFFTPSDPTTRYLMIITAIRFHHTLTVIDLEEKRILHYDSLAKNEFKELPEAPIISKFVRRITKLKSNTTEWTAHNITRKTHQHQKLWTLSGGLDLNCTLYACQTAMDLSKGMSPNEIIRQSHRREAAAEFRKRFQQMARDPYWFRVEENQGKLIFIPRFSRSSPMKILGANEILFYVGLEINSFVDKLIEDQTQTEHDYVPTMM